jgi:hypothetical protein
MPIKLMTEAALVAAFLAGATPAEAQSFHNVVETFYADEFRAHPIAATDIGVHDYDAEVDDLSRDGQAKNTARLHTAHSSQSIRRRWRPATATIGRC